MSRVLFVCKLSNTETQPGERARLVFRVCRGFSSTSCAGAINRAGKLYHGVWSRFCFRHLQQCEPGCVSVIQLILFRTSNWHLQMVRPNGTRMTKILYWSRKNATNLVTTNESCDWNVKCKCATRRHERHKKIFQNVGAQFNKIRFYPNPGQYWKWISCRTIQS